MHDDNDPQINWQLIADLRRMAKEGSKVPELAVKIELSTSASNAFLCIVYFSKAFHLTIREVTDLATWDKFKKYYNPQPLSDEQINELMMPIILSKRESWDK